MVLLPNPDELQRGRLRIERATLIVMQQRARIASLVLASRNTDTAEALLTTFEQGLQVMREHLAVEEELARER